MKSILITGVSGFVGSNFVRSFSKNHIIYGLDIIQKSINGVKEIFSWDELDEMPQVDTIIHLAGIAHDTKDKTKSDIYFEVNTGLTKKIFDYFLQSETKKFIFFSSVKAAADSVVGNILTEEIPPKPAGPYGESKIKAEEYLLSKLAYAQETNKEVIILRPAMIYGIGNKGNLNLLYKVVAKRIPWPLGSYENKRSFCAIDNISYTVEGLIMNNGNSTGIYQVCDDETLSTNELIEIIANSLNRKAQIWKVPKVLINSIATIGTIFHLPLTKERLRKLTENYVVSNKKIKETLGVEKMPVNAKKALELTFKSFN